MKIYTKTGDDGTTGLQGGRRTPKSGRRIAAYGSIDEVNCMLGVIASGGPDADVSRVLVHLQNELFVVGADLSNPDLADHKNRVTRIMTGGLERQIDEFEGELEPLASFILPGGSPVAALVHLARAAARRAETLIVALGQHEGINSECAIYVNRLSDLLFVMARVVNSRAGIPDTIWSPPKDTL